MSSSYLTVAEIADRLRVSRMTIYRAIESGELASVKVGRSIRVRPEAVHQWLGGDT